MSCSRPADPAASIPLPPRGSVEALLATHLALLHRPDLLALLLETFGDLDAFHALLRDPSNASPEREQFLEELSPRFRRRLREGEWIPRAREELEQLEARGVDLLCRGTPGYPPTLADLSHAPLALFARGSLTERDRISVGLIGTRRPSPYGERQARRFGGELARGGVTVVSGLARGVDGIAHRAALEAGGRTLAVLGSGLGRIYPRENRELAGKIHDSGQGALLSEFPHELGPFRHHFPLRNRLISGLSTAVLVIEASERSGTLHTVDWALEQDRPVFVLPGRVEDPESLGCLRLLQAGATPVASPGELLELLEPSGKRGGVPATPEEEAPEYLSGPFFQKLRPLFRERDLWHPDELQARLGGEPLETLAELDLLEAAGALRRGPGGAYSLA